MASIGHASTSAHVAFAARLSAWIDRAGVVGGDAIGELAVGIADTLNAIARAAPVVEALVELDPTTETGADRALDQLGRLHALLITEAKYHLEEAERRWPELENALLARLPDDPEDEDQPAVSNDR